jgi:hypothetical protein
MPQVQTVYTTSDGRRFADAAMAERHERLAEARDKYAAAQREYARALLETQVTADGRPFRFGALTDYYYVHPNHNVSIRRRIEKMTYQKRYGLAGTDVGHLTLVDCGEAWAASFLVTVDNVPDWWDDDVISTLPYSAKDVNPATAIVAAAVASMWSPHQNENTVYESSL